LSLKISFTGTRPLADSLEKLRIPGASTLRYATPGEEDAHIVRSVLYGAIPALGVDGTLRALTAYRDSLIRRSGQAAEDKAIN
jgi:hypothetical protein